VTPTVFNGTIELSHAVRLLRRVEAHHDQQGWHPHANMHVYVVYDHHDVVTGGAIERTMQRMGPPVRNSRYSAQPMLPSRLFAAVEAEQGLYPPAALYRFAFNTAYADSTLIEATEPVTAESLEAFRELVRMPGVLGYIACSEAHMLVGDRATEAHRRRVRFAQMPDAVELRTAMMVDVEDRVHSVARPRAQAAEIAADCDFGGRIVNALRMLMDVTAGRLAEDQEQFDERYPCAEHPSSERRTRYPGRARAAAVRQPGGEPRRPSRADRG